jgi:N-acyl-phosphatidylethanolamine-hydrolysing phospholipase D
MMVNAFRLLVKYLLIGTVFLLFLSACTMPSYNPAKPHHTRNGFRNLEQHTVPDFLDFLKWRIGRVGKSIPDPDTYHFPIAPNNPGFLHHNGTNTAVTWIGHATVLLQLDGKNILTDPHFTERASPVSWAGPRRVIRPGIPLAELPPIDIVVISHDHYDSLDSTTITMLRDRPGGADTVFFVPLGLKDWFLARGVTRVHEMDWWEQRDEQGLEIIAVPVQHWSKRSVFSRNRTLWAGWVIRGDMFNFFFCGDTGYTPHFKKIGSTLGPFDLAAIPIGAYEPRWFMRYHHVSPEEAVRIHLDVRSKQSIAIHWGTFILTDEPLDEPPGRLKQAAREMGLPPNSFRVPVHGETIVVK